MEEADLHAILIKATSKRLNLLTNHFCLTCMFINLSLSNKNIFREPSVQDFHLGKNVQQSNDLITFVASHKAQEAIKLTNWKKETGNEHIVQATNQFVS